MSDPHSNSGRSALAKAQSFRMSLQGAQRQVADYILEKVDEVVYLSVGELADRSGVSESTVVRVCRSLGFSGFQDLKIQLAQSLVGEAQEVLGDLEPMDAPEVVLEKTFRANMRALEDSLSTVERSVFAQAVEAIADARMLMFFGVGASGAVAMDANDKFTHTGIPVVAHTDVVLQLLSASTARPSDVVVGISQSGATRPIVLALKAARQNGATTVCITSRNQSPITKVADLKLLVSATELSVREHVGHELRLAHLSLIDALYLSVGLMKRETFLFNKQRADQIRQHIRVSDKDI